jgi:hypothetical protein
VIHHGDEQVEQNNDVNDREHAEHQQAPESENQQLLIKLKHMLQ